MGKIFGGGFFAVAAVAVIAALLIVKKISASNTAKISPHHSNSLSRGGEQMSKRDERMLEELRYTNSKEIQSGNDISNTFYMYILIITILAAAVSQFVVDHITAATSSPPLQITPKTIDIVTFFLLVAGVIFSWLCFTTYAKIAQRQLELLTRREKIKCKYDSVGYTSVTSQAHPAPAINAASSLEISDPTAFVTVLDEMQKQTLFDFVPTYMRHLTALAGSLCSFGGVTISSATIAFLITPYQLLIGYIRYQDALRDVIILYISLCCLFAFILFTYHKRSLKSLQASSTAAQGTATTGQKQPLGIRFQLHLRTYAPYTWSYLLIVLLGGISCAVGWWKASSLHSASQNASDYTHLPLLPLVIQKYNMDPLPASEIYLAALLLGIVAFVVTYLLFGVCSCISACRFDNMKQKYVDNLRSFK